MGTAVEAAVPHWDMASALGPLFDADLPPEVPAGFHHREGFITVGEESALAAEIERVEFADFEMRGVVARRRVAFFGRSYDAGRASTPPLPAFLLPLRARVAVWAGVEADAFAMALINEYRPGAPIGWHRDAPQYAIVAGISLLSTCRMRFRPYLSPPAAARAKAEGHARRTMTHEITLEPRSAYLMTGESRSAYEHHIPAVTTLRYSITFRTLRD
jgi:alkylated DNA repair dioxygenase AlkB